MKQKDIDKLFQKPTILSRGLAMDVPKTKIKKVDKNLYIDKDGIYVTRFMFNGKVFEKRLTSTSKFDLRIEIAGYMKEIKEGGKGLHLSKSMPTINKAIELWEEGKKGQVTERYRIKTGQALRNLLSDKIGYIKADEIKAPALNKILRDYHNTSYFRKGIECHHTERNHNFNVNIFKSLFGFLEDEEILLINPTRKLKELTEPEKKRKQINQSNIKAFFCEVDKVGSFSLSFQTRAMFYLGLRVGEATKMKWASWDKENSTYTPGQNSTTKGKEATTLDIPTPMLEWFTKVEAQESKNLIYMCVNKKTNKPYTTTIVDLQFQAISETFKSKITPHDLRSSFITNLSQKHDLPTVQAAARHKNISTTMIYVNVSQRRVKQAILGTFNKLA